MDLEKSKMARKGDIPRDIIYASIFPRLPYKSVMRMKCVSVDERDQITDDSRFAAKQSKLCPPCPAIIYIGQSKKDSSEYFMDILSTTSYSVGVPSSRLDFLGYSIDHTHFNLLGSSNGLLCICCKLYNIGPLTPATTFLIVNPATQQSQPIPGAAQHLFWGKPVGLVFDPCDQPIGNAHKFQIIDAVPCSATHDTFLEFGFDIFSSNTGQWIMSDTTLNVTIRKPKYGKYVKVIYTRGIVYWEYVEDLIWFDATMNIAGVLKMPTKKIMESKYEEWERHSIDVSSNGMVMCTIVNKDGLEMFELRVKGDHFWELRHKKQWKEIMSMSGDAFQFCHSMKLRNAWQLKIFYEKWSVRPLGLESGQYIYLGVRRNYKTSDRVLCYDMETGKVEDIGKELGNAFEENCAFGYRNSMAALPPINVPNSEDGISGSKPGG